MLHRCNFGFHARIWYRDRLDSVSVINIVLAVGLSVDYSAHEAHCFMVKPGYNKNERALEALADLGAAVLSGAISTFLAVVVFLFSSCVFRVSSKEFTLIVALGVTDGLILLPFLLSLFGPKPFSSAEKPADGAEKPMTVTSHSPEDDGSSEGQKQKAEIDDKQKRRCGRSIKISNWSPK
jgi:Niemann-Pick C1 protein